MQQNLIRHFDIKRKNFQVSETIKQFNVDDVTLKKIMAVFIEEAESGLQSENGGRNSIKMLPSYVRQLPNGREEGNFLALDLGGTNFRVLLINLHSKKSTAKSKTYRIPRNIMTGTGTEVNVSLVNENIIARRCFSDNVNDFSSLIISLNG